MRLVTLAMKIKLIAVIVVLAMVSPASSFGGFSDVASEAFYAKPVAWMADANITTGYAPGCFGPDRAITRGDAMVFLWRLEGRPQAADRSPFRDVSAAYQRPAVDWAYESGTTTGTSATSFSPDAFITRGDFVTLLARYSGGSWTGAPMPFTDVYRSYQRGPVAWAAANGVSTGTSATTFHPSRNLSRGEAATFIWRMEGQPDVEPEAFDNYCPEGIRSLECVPDSAADVGWRGAGLIASDLTDKREGEVKITTDGAVLENFDVSGNIIVDADNVVIRRGRIRFSGDSSFAVIVNRGRNLLIEDVEIDGNDQAENGIWDEDYTARRVDVHSVYADAFKAHGQVTIEQVVAHDRYAFKPQAHADAVQVQYGTGIVIRCSRFDWGIPPGYGVDDLGKTISGGQGLWITNTGQGEPIDQVIVENVILNAVGYAIGFQTETFGALCNVLVTSDTGWGVFHPDAVSAGGVFQYELVVDASDNTTVAPPVGGSLTAC